MIPPLHRRTDEIPKLVDIFVRGFSSEFGRAQPPRIAPDAMVRLLRHPWPGNVDELMQVVRRALLSHDGPEICAGDLPIDLAALFARPRASWRNPPRAPESRCALCGQLDAEVRKMLGGAGAFICDRCVEEAQAIACAVTEQSAGPSDTDVGCAFCGKSSREVRHLVGADTALICDDCLNAYDGILGEWFPGPWPVGETVTLRTVYPRAAVDATISRAREQLGRRKPCRVVILVDDGKMAAARSLMDEVKGALADVAHFWEHDAAFPEAALTAIALPRPGRDSPVA